MLQKGEATSTFCNMIKFVAQRNLVVIRATNHLNLQRNIVPRQVARKMLPVLLGLNTQNHKQSITAAAGDMGMVKTK